MVADTPSSDDQVGVCPVCENELLDRRQRYCCYCRTPLGLPVAKLPSLSDVVGFTVIRKVAWDAPGVFYEAERDGVRLLVSLLEEGDAIYSTSKYCRESGKEDPYATTEIAPHPNLVRVYPIFWRDKVAVAAIDYIDGQNLGDWWHAVGPIDTADAVTIALKCLYVFRHLGEYALHRRISPETIQIGNDGHVSITAFASVMCSRFYLDGQHRSVSILKTDLKRLFRFSSMGCAAPEYDSETYRAGKYSSDQLRLQQIYALGGLLYELLVDHSLPSIRHGEHLVKNVEFVPPHELRADVPQSLSDIVAKMIRWNAAERYQSFEEPIADLEALQLASDRVSFITRSGPPINPSEQAALAKRQWVHRQGDYDFRRIKWGMTVEEVRQTEIDVVTRAMPAAIFIQTEYEGMSLSVTYQFAEEQGKTICVGAMISSEGLFGSSGKHDPFGDSQGIYDKLKQLMTAEYGAPAVEEGPLLQDLDMVELIAQSEGISTAEVLKGCKSTTWITNDSRVALSVRPSIQGLRMITATVQSARHDHLY